MYTQKLRHVKIYLLKTKSKRFGVIRSPSSVDKNVRKKLYNLCWIKWKFKLKILSTRGNNDIIKI